MKKNSFCAFDGDNENEDIETADEQQVNYTVNSDESADGSFLIKVGEKLIACMMIVGQIEGHYLLPQQTKTTKYEHIIPRIISFDANESIDGLLIILNTIGGDIEAGMAISELISGLKKPTVSLVLGGGHSIGIPLAVAAKKSFITPSATMTVHPVRMNGLVMGVPQQLAYFQNMQERIIDFVCSHSSIKEDKFREMMLSSGRLVSDFGTVLEGTEAVNEGLIDSIGTISDAINELTKM